MLGMHHANLTLDEVDQPLARSGKVLIQVGTTCRPAGWAARPATFSAANALTMTRRPAAWSKRGVLKTFRLWARTRYRTASKQVHRH
jgi:hypothetical protein